MTDNRDWIGRVTDLYEDEPPLRPGGNRDWIGRVRQADADAEEAWMSSRTTRDALLGRDKDPNQMYWQAMFAIAAELRAQRISKRPGAGTATVPGAPTPQ